MNAVKQSRATAETVETSYIEADGIRFAYRTFGKQTDVPLVFCQRFRGTMDDWDPAFVNALAKERTVILFDSAGVGLSSGEVAESFYGTGKFAVTFIEALGLKQVDLIGFSMGGYVAQIVTLNRPDLVRRLILAGTGGGTGEGTQSGKPEVFQVAFKPVNEPEDFLYLFFEQTETSRAAGLDYLERLARRKDGRAPLVKPESVQAQLKSAMAWGTNSTFDRLGEIKQPVLVANGDNDIMIPTINSYIVSQRIPNAQLIIYPDSGHGFLFQYPDLFAEHVSMFLNRD
ncbi:alpha/beta fold hydrolase [Paenibacillus alginolyticus]|uniref:Alpha/beta hydrolase n=1 Tax=Paenibacillus alginolyticus TaxID=59839 RepID=A0ABT4G928_9BACL|nr:alpha/beta hydrolase [Paenibacillus alginolyticus]MCY9692684.1 alpha/beta hydrolase [Paenibacillus alginolyticus]MEC0144389.1 alpha/beta hydrolase [Paenibacillus alginolyticus]